jgi:predicted cupin superfamily sugar epimerase
MFFKPQRYSQQLKSARYWIDSLGLNRHPEGGYFRETYRAHAEFNIRGVGRRHASSAIYYLLEKGQFSAFHRIKSDEVWHFYAGSPLAIHVIDGAKLATITLGGDPGKGQSPQAVVRAGRWFAASAEKGYALVGCTVSPGFDYADWERGDRKKLVKEYPEHKRVIEKYSM